MARRNMKTIRTLVIEGDRQAWLEFVDLYKNNTKIPVTRTSPIFIATGSITDSATQFVLGISCEYGIGGRKNKREAIRWFNLSAKAGNRNAQQAMGLVCFYGEMRQKNLGKATFWLEESAEQGLINAQVLLGDILIAEESVKDTHAGFDWLKKSVKNSDADSFPSSYYSLACSYYFGEGTKQNFAKALGLFMRAVQLNFPPAQLLLAQMYANGEGVEKDSEMAFYWCEKSFDQDFLPAKHSLACLHLDRVREGDVKYHLAQALKLWRAAAKQGCEKSMYALYLRYAYGEGVKVNPLTALQWLKKAVNAGHEEARLKLTVILSRLLKDLRIK